MTDEFIYSVYHRPSTPGEDSPAVALFILQETILLQYDAASLNDKFQTF